MGTVLTFRASAKTALPPAAAGARHDCEVVIFPGVRIERHDHLDLDLSHRLCDSAGRDDFGGIGGHRPRKTS